MASLLTPAEVNARRIAGLEKARLAKAARRAAPQQEEPMPEDTNGTTPRLSPPALQDLIMANALDAAGFPPDALPITPVPPTFPNATPDDDDYVGSIPLQPVPGEERDPATYALWTPTAPEFVPSAGNLTKFFPGYKPRGVYYNVELTMRTAIMGGTPADPHLMEGWLRRLGLGVGKDEEIRAIVVRTMKDLGADLSAEPTMEELEEASKKIAEVKQTNMFRRSDALGCYLESRVVKAMLKENTNIAFAQERWGPTKKGAKAFLAERVFVDPDVIPVQSPRPDVHRPDGVHLFIGHVTGPQGRQSTLTYYEYITAPILRFTITVFEDAIKNDQWGAIWESAQNNGQGSLRSQGFGRFDLTGWNGPHGLA